MKYQIEMVNRNIDLCGNVKPYVVIYNLLSRVLIVYLWHIQGGI